MRNSILKIYFFNEKNWIKYILKKYQIKKIFIK